MGSTTKFLLVLQIRTALKGGVLDPIANKSLNNFILTIFVLIFVSCVTTIEFGVEHPPLVDMRNMETITVIPLEWKIMEAMTIWQMI
jgi:hypothetical protein